MQRAAEALDQLRSNSIADAEFVDGRDGGDVSTFLDDSIRYARAAYAVVHTVIDKETPNGQRTATLQRRYRIGHRARRAALRRASSSPARNRCVHGELPTAHRPHPVAVSHLA